MDKVRIAKAHIAMLGLCASLVMAAQQLPSSPRANTKDKEPVTRTLTGRVTNQAGSSLPQSVVYLTNTRTMAVKTYIVKEDGEYRFPALSPNADYQVYATYRDSRSDTKTLSSFDSHPQAVINLKIEQK